MRRVVVTGVGLVTPLAGDTQHSWERLIKNQSGIRRIDTFDVSDLPAQIAGLVPQGEGAGQFNANQWMEPKDQRKIDAFILYGLAAASQAIEDAGWTPTDEYLRERTGVMIGCGIGGLNRIYETSVDLHTKGCRRVSPYFITASLINLVSGHVSIKYGFTGPNHAVVTACSTGAHAIGDAARMIQLGDAEVMVAGGAEAAVCRLGIAGFASARALSTNFNDCPEKASRPWDKDRDGFVMGEGAGIVVLEDLEHATRRGAKIYAELVGYGLSGDAYHITAPHPEGRGGYKAMYNALKSAKLEPEAVEYINAHGTSTPLGDEIELGAVQQLFEKSIDQLSVSSTKSAIGHLLGAAGGVEAIFSIFALKYGILPPTLNLDHPADSCRGVDLVPHQAKEKKLKYAMSNSFGFGGTNASLVFSRFSDGT
jgi:3-oxoacyl-[acyl-carrier-protein] synthase II